MRAILHKDLHSCSKVKMQTSISLIRCKLGAPPSSDALVLEVAISAYDIYRVLIDNGILVNLLTYTTFQKMGFLDKDLTTTSDSLYDFINNIVFIKGKIRFLVTVGEAPRSATRLADFIAVDENISYNAILGRPILKDTKIITSIYYLTIKFPTPRGVGVVRGFQYDSR